MGTLIVALVAVVVVLPKMVGTPGGEPGAGPPSEAEVSNPDTLVPPIKENATNPIIDGLNHALDEALLEGRSALIAREPEAAAAAFERASVLEPGNAAAEDGLRRSKILFEVRDLEVAAVSHENLGERAAAAGAARRALKLDSSSKIARAVANRVIWQDTMDAYNGHITRGLAALEDGEYQKAIDAFSAASKLSPTAPEVTDGLGRARAGIHRQKVSAHLARAAEAEEAERWSAAVEEYRSVLALEPNLADARDGLARSNRRLDLSQKMDYHLTHPERLATAAVLREAADLVAEAGGLAPRGPQFSALIDRLDHLVGQFSIPVPVVLESDGITEIVLHRIGELGVFDRRTVELRPGTYTVVGRRPGYRDVRLEFEVGPGQSPPPVIIRCTERI